MRTLKSGYGVANDLHQLTRIQMRNVIGDMRGRTLLDVGCASNNFCDIMRQDGLKTVGVDHDRYERCDVHASAMHLPFADNTFDIITAISLTDLLFDYERNTLYQEVNRVVKPSGFFVRVAGVVDVNKPNHWEQKGNYGISIFQILKATPTNSK